MLKSTKESVIEYLDEFYVANGSIPSLRKIRQAIGTGSLTTISDATREWRQMNNLPAQDRSGVSAEDGDDELVRQLTEAVTKAFSATLKRKLQAESHSLKKQLEEKTVLLDEATKKCAALENEILEKNQELNRVRTSLELEKLARAKIQGALDVLVKNSV